MDPDAPVLNLDLWRADAVVLHFWLTTVDLDTLPFEHAGQRQALLDLLTELDQTVAAQVDDAEIVRSHDLVDRTGTSIDPDRVRILAAGAGAGAGPPSPDEDDDEDDYGLEPF